MTGINTSLMDMRVLTVICVVVAHQFHQLKQM